MTLDNSNPLVWDVTTMASDTKTAANGRPFSAQCGASKVCRAPYFCLPR